MGWEEPSEVREKSGFCRLQSGKYFLSLAIETSGEPAQRRHLWFETRGGGRIVLHDALRRSERSLYGR